MSYSTRPLNFSEIISQAIKLCSITYKKNLFYAFIVSVMGLLGVVATNITVSSIREAIVWGIVALVLIIVAFIIGIANYAALVNATNNGGGKYNIEIRNGLKYFWPVLFATIICSVAIMVGFSILFLSGIFLSVALFIYLPMVIVDNKKVFSAFVESIRLTWGNWWRTFWILVFSIFCYAICYMILALIIIGIPSFFIGSGYGLETTYLSDIVHVITGTLFYPWFIALALVLLNDFKVRKA